MPDPAPATVHDPPLPAEVVDAAGRPVRVSGRGEVSAPPATVPGRPARRPGPGRRGGLGGPVALRRALVGLRGHRRRARLQVTTAGGVAYLLAVEAGRWSVEATYD